LSAWRQKIKKSGMRGKKIQKITDADLRFIYGEDYLEFVEKILPNCFCSVCFKQKGEPTVITNYQSSIDELNNIILRGFCKECGRAVGRYVEAGEVAKYLVKIKRVKNKK